MDTQNLLSAPGSAFSAIAVTAGTPLCHANSTEDQGRYQFPIIRHASPFTSMSDNELGAALDRLLKSKDSDGMMVSYLEIREDVCSIHIEMNHRGLLPPGFRPMRSPGKPSAGKVWTAEETTLGRDRQVIDLHWLSIHCKKREVDDKEFHSILRDDDFDFYEAGKLACKSWTAGSRASFMALSPFEQIQTWTLRSSQIRDRVRHAESDRIRVIEPALRHKSESRRYLTPDLIEDMSDLWLANAMLKRAKLSIVGQIHGWLRKQPPLANSTLSAKLTRMRKWTGA